MAPKRVEKGPNRPAGHQPWWWPAGCAQSLSSCKKGWSSDFFQKSKFFFVLHSIHVYCWKADFSNLYQKWTQICNFQIGTAGDKRKKNVDFLISIFSETVHFYRNSFDRKLNESLKHQLVKFHVWWLNIMAETAILVLFIITSF